MSDHPGHVWALIQEWLDAFTYRPPSQRELAPRLRVSVSTLGDYRFARHMPPPAFVVRLADEIQVPYERVLDAVLKDHGYRGDSLQAVRQSISEAKLDEFMAGTRKGEKDEKPAEHGESA